MAVLEREGCLFVGKPEFLRLRPELDDICRGNSWLDDADRRVHVVAAAFIGVNHRRRCAADRESSIVTGTVAIEAVQDVEEGRITGAEHTIRVDMRVGA